MEQGCCLLVYPGGAREAWKRTTDKPYDILWGIQVQFSFGPFGEAGGEQYLSGESDPSKIQKHLIKPLKHTSTIKKPEMS